MAQPFFNLSASPALHQATRIIAVSVQIYAWFKLTVCNVSKNPIQL